MKQAHLNPFIKEVIMAVVSKSTLKGYFEDGKEPDEPKYIDFIDTMGVFGSWTDYSSLASIVGWSSYTVKQVWYKNHEGRIFVNISIDGTSNSTVSTVTLPYNTPNVSGLYWNGANPTFNNGGWDANVGRWNMSWNSNVVQLFRNGGSVWTASGRKLMRVSFSYESA